MLEGKKMRKAIPFEQIVRIHKVDKQHHSFKELVFVEALCVATKIEAARSNFVP